MKLHRLTDKGLEAFNDFLDSLTTDSPQPRPDYLLTDPQMCEPVEPAVEIEQRGFANRFEAGEYLYQRLKGIPNVERDRGLWAWLALFYFEQLCPPDASGKRKPGERARWIPAIGDYRKYYRHLLAGPYRVYRGHSDNPRRAMALLCSPLHQISDTYRELAERQELITNKAVVAVATRLYYDAKSGKLKRLGTRGNPGTPRRLVQVLLQFDLTWDLYGMDADELLTMLPAEFDRFRTGGQTTVRA